MKEIKAIIDPGMLYRVMDALHNQPHFPGVTVSDAQGQGRGRGPGHRYVSTGNALAFSRKLRLEIACSDSMCADLVSVIRKAAHIADAGHGVIIVNNIDNVIRLSSGEEQDDAV